MINFTKGNETKRIEERKKERRERKPIACSLFTSMGLWTYQELHTQGQENGEKKVREGENVKFGMQSTKYEMTSDQFNEK